MVNQIFLFIKRNLLDVRTYKWLATGFLSFIADYSFYTFLLSYVQMDFAKASGVLLGIIISFSINRNWTFKSKSKISGEAKKFILLYFINLVLNVFINKYIFVLTNNIQIAYFISLFVIVIIGFLGQKYWVFKSK
tara:strand:+ start:17519 stop:17923 length:405 start_codon:yes stop_codon:yes gene_type:complete